MAMTMTVTVSSDWDQHTTMPDHAQLWNGQNQILKIKIHAE